VVGKEPRGSKRGGKGEGILNVSKSSGVSNAMERPILRNDTAKGPVCFVSGPRGDPEKRNMQQTFWRCG